MRGCEHDPIYSGAINLDRRFACICRKCGECWWSERYDIHLVDLEQYHALRVLHGWATPRKLPAPPRVPSNVTPRSSENSHYVPAMLLFAFLFVMCGLSGVPWWTAFGHPDWTVMPRWLSIVSSGFALLMTTICYLGWKRGF